MPNVATEHDVISKAVHVYICVGWAPTPKQIESFDHANAPEQLPREILAKPL